MNFLLNLVNLLSNGVLYGTENTSDKNKGIGTKNIKKCISGQV